MVIDRAEVPSAADYIRRACAFCCEQVNCLIFGGSDSMKRYCHVIQRGVPVIPPSLLQYCCMSETPHTAVDVGMAVIVACRLQRVRSLVHPWRAVICFMNWPWYSEVSLRHRAVINCSSLTWTHHSMNLPTWGEKHPVIHDIRHHQRSKAS